MILFITVQFCFIKPLKDALKIVLEKAEIVPELLQSDLSMFNVTSKECRCRGFKLGPYVEEVMKTGRSMCPHCSHDMSFSSLATDTSQFNTLPCYMNGLEKIDLGDELIFLFDHHKRSESEIEYVPESEFADPIEIDDLELRFSSTNPCKDPDAYLSSFLSGLGTYCKDPIIKTIFSDESDVSDSSLI